MLKKIGITILYILFSFCVFSEDGKGTLHVDTQIIPVGTTKKYNYENSLIFDGGTLNSNSNIKKIPLASVTVRMYTEKTGGSGTANGIAGEFNQSFQLKRFEEILNNSKIDLGEVIQYKGGQGASMKLFADNFRIISVNVEKEDTSKPDYYFVAYPEDATIWNQVTNLTYTFDFYLEVNNIKGGDIIRQDVTTGKTSDLNLDAVGSIKDIVKDQFRMLR